MNDYRPIFCELSPRVVFSQIASEYGVNPAQVSQWKKQVLEELPQLFSSRRAKTVSDNDQLVAELYRQIGQLKVELDWLQKKTSRLG